MATTTTNNGWDIPQSTDLVKDGATAIATLGQDIDTSVGTGLLAWTAFTPTLTNITKGTGPTEAYHYAQLGKIVIARYKLVLGTSGAVTGLMTFTLPVTASSNAVNQITNVLLSDSGTTLNPGTATIATTTTVTLQAQNAGGTYLYSVATSATIPFTWAVNDGVYFTLIYQAA